MSPLKLAAALAACALLFWLGLRLARRVVDLGIAAGYAEERRVAAEAEAERRAAEGEG